MTKIGMTRPLGLKTQIILWGICLFFCISSPSWGANKKAKTSNPPAPQNEEEPFDLSPPPGATYSKKRTKPSAKDADPDSFRAPWQLHQANEREIQLSAAGFGFLSGLETTRDYSIAKRKVVTQRTHQETGASLGIEYGFFKFLALGVGAQFKILKTAYRTGIINSENGAEDAVLETTGGNDEIVSVTGALKFRAQIEWMDFFMGSHLWATPTVSTKPLSKIEPTYYDRYVVGPYFGFSGTIRRILTLGLKAEYFYRSLRYVHFTSPTGSTEIRGGNRMLGTAFLEVVGVPSSPGAYFQYQRNQPLDLGIALGNRTDYRSLGTLQLVDVFRAGAHMRIPFLSFVDLVPDLSYGFTRTRSAWGGDVVRYTEYSGSLTSLFKF